MFGFSPFAATPFAALPSTNVYPPLYTNTQTFYEITLYIYPWHPNCLPGDMTLQTAARQAMTTGC
jgi:hypothetical protein